MPTTNEIVAEESSKIEGEEGADDTETTNDDGADETEDTKDSDEDTSDEKDGGETGGEDSGEGDSEDDEEDSDSDEDESLEEEEEDEETEDEEEEEQDTSTELGQYLDTVDKGWVPKNYKELLQKAAEAGLAAVKDEANKLRAATEAEQAEKDKQLAELNKTWDREIAGLVKDGDMPKDKAESKKVQKEVFKFMAKENERRDEKKIPKVTSFRDAYTLMEAAKSKKKAKAEADSDAEADNKRAGMVGGNSTKGGKGKVKGVLAGQTVYDILAEEMTE